MKTMCHNISFIVCVVLRYKIRTFYLVIWILRNVCLWDESLFGFVVFCLVAVCCCDEKIVVILGGCGCLYFFCLLLFVKYLW